MKKLSIAILTLVSALFMFSSCSDDDAKNLALAGFWQCTSVGGNVAGVSTAKALKTDYLKLLSIGFVPTSTGSGLYYRTKTDGLTSSGLTSSSDSSKYSKFFDKGTYTYTNDNLVLTSSDGATTTYTVSLSSSSLELTETLVSASTSTTATAALSLINSIFGTSATTTVGIVYTYTPLANLDALQNLFSSSTSAE